jgi:hypothetical protein
MGSAKGAATKNARSQSGRVHLSRAEFRKAWPINTRETANADATKNIHHHLAKNSPNPLVGVTMVESSGTNPTITSIVNGYNARPAQKRVRRIFRAI